MNVFELFGQMSIKGLDKTKQQLSGLEKNVQKVQKGMKIMGAAFTAVGVAGLAIIQSTKKVNAQLSVTAASLGITTKEMRDLTLATTNVTFPIDEVTASFDFLARAGIRDTEVLKATAIAFDTLGDATGRSASQVTEIMVPAMKTFRLSAEEIASKIDMMTFMTRNSTISLEDFNTMVGYTDQEMVAAGFTIDDMAASMMYMSDEGVEPGRVMLREWMKAVTRSKEENISMTEALGMTNIELETYTDKLEGAVGLAAELGDLFNEQYTILDKLKQKWSELTLSASAYLEPLEPILAGMTALGPLMIGLSMVGIPKLIIGVKALGHALKTVLLNPIVLLIAALVALGVVTYNLIQHDIAANKMNKARAKIVEELAKSEGKLTEGVLLAHKAYNELALASGLLSDEQEELILKTQESIALWEDGTYAINEMTGALELVAGAIESTTKARFEDYRAILLEKEAQKELNAEIEKEIETRNDLLGIISQQLGLGASLADLSNLTEMLTPFAGTAAGAAMGWSGLGITIPQPFQEGGVITKPTLAILGEQAPRVKEFVFNEKQLEAFAANIPGPTPLYDLMSQRPYAGESGGGFETSGISSLTINIIEPHVRDDRDIDLMMEKVVTRVRQKTGMRI